MMNPTVISIWMNPISMPIEYFNVVRPKKKKPEYLNIQTHIPTFKK